jgi:hypothetical protein
LFASTLYFKEFVTKLYQYPWSFSRCSLWSFLLAPHWTLSFFDRGSALAVTPDGLRCQSREQKEWHGCRATKGVQGKGRYYYEATVTDEGLCRVGWSTQQVG